MDALLPLLEATLLVLSFPLGEALRLYLLQRWFPGPPAWQAAVWTGLVVLALNVCHAAMGSPLPMVGAAFPAWWGWPLAVLFNAMAWATTIHPLGRMLAGSPRSPGPKP